MASLRLSIRLAFDAVFTDPAQLVSKLILRMGRTILAAVTYSAGLSSSLNVVLQGPFHLSSRHSLFFVRKRM